MLAGIPSNEDRALEIFRLALRTLERNKDAPEVLKKYFTEVISQAFTLADDPSKISKNIMPEAIRLAVEMRATDALKTSIASAIRAKDIDKTIAKEILEQMEYKFAS
jgi:hypothetical protein